MQAPQRGVFKLVTEKQQRDFRLEQAHLRALARQQHQSTWSYRIYWLLSFMMAMIIGLGLMFAPFYLLSFFCK